MSSTKKAAASRSKAPKGRPTSTSALAQPAAPHSLPTLSSFSPDGALFAFVTLAVDKHRLRIYHTSTSRAVAEYTVESGRVSSLIWNSLPTEAFVQDSNSPAKKRKKVPSSTTNEDAASGKEVTVVVLGLSDGVVLFFSPSHSKIIRSLTHSTSTSSILALAVGSTNKSHIWTSSADSSVRLWDIINNDIIRSWKNEDRIPSTSLAVRTSVEDTTDLLVGHHHIRLLTNVSAQNPLQTKPKQAASFAGHASSITTLLWSHSHEESARFFSSAEADRFIYVWDTANASVNGKPVASISLDSDAKVIGLTAPYSPTQCLITLSASGRLSFIPIPSDLPHSTGNTSSKLHNLLPRATLNTTKNSLSDPPVMSFSLSMDGTSICVVRLAKGIKPVFDTVRYLDDNGNYIQNLTLDEVSQDAVEEGSQSAPNKRYVEPSSLAVGSGFDLVQGAADEDSAAQHEVDGSLQVDLAELSLGQRLTAVPENDANYASDSDDGDDPKDPARSSKSTKKQSRTEISEIPANSLTRTLIQALHSSDSRLLEMCLAHSDPALIANTVRRLPPQLAIPLISACVERLGRGPRAANMKGSSGGASSQRGSALLVWLKTVLAVHTGHLMTIPDLVARLSGLHATLTARLSLHDSLLSLSGRLDMVLSQVEMRTSVAPSSLAPAGGRGGKTKHDAIVRRYVEGETDSGEDDATMNVEVEADSDEEGSVEDIELGGDSENEESDEAEFSDSEDEEGGMSKFIDDEAEEEFSDEEGEDESE